MAQMTCSPWSMISCVPSWGHDTWGSVFFHLLLGGCRKLQAFPTGKTTPVVADDGVIEEGVIVFDDIHAHMGQQDTQFFCPIFTSSGMWISMCDNVKRECNLCKSPSSVTIPPSKDHNGETLSKFFG